MAAVTNQAGFPGVRALMERVRRHLSRPGQRLRLMTAVLTVLLLVLGPLIMLDCLLLLPDHFDEPLASALYRLCTVLKTAILLFVGLPMTASAYRMAVHDTSLPTDTPPEDDPAFASGWDAIGEAFTACLWCFSSPRACLDCLKVSAAWLLWMIELLLFPAAGVCVFAFEVWDRLPLSSDLCTLLYALTVLAAIGLTFVTLLLSGSPAAYGYAVFDPAGRARCPFGRVLWARGGTRRTQLLLRLRMTGWSLLSAALVFVPLPLITLPCCLTAAACFGRAADQTAD